MREQDPRERARAGLAEALARYGREWARQEARGAEPWPGDLFVLPETADWPVEWLLVERAREGRCLVVAADAHPVLGCADVAIGPEAEGGPLSIRADVGLWIGIESLRRAERTGALAAEDLDRVRRKRAGGGIGGMTDSRLGEDGEPDPEYEDWLDEVVLPARGALPPAFLEEPEGSRSRRWSRIGVPGAAALALFLAFCEVSILAWRYHQAESRASRQVERLGVERRHLETEHRRQLETERQRFAAAAARHLEELRAARKAPTPVSPSREARLPLANLMYASLYPGESRGAVSELDLPPQTTYLFLLLDVGVPPSFPEYRLEVSSRAPGAAAWVVDHLRLLPSQEVSVALPRTQLPDGTYLLRLYGRRDGERQEVGRYELRLRSGDGTPER